MSRFLYVKKAGAWRIGTDYRQKAILPRRERIALSANERTAEFLDFAIQAKFAYGNKLRWRTGVRMKTILRICKRFFEELSSQCAPGSDIRINGGEIIA